uniref:Capsular polysaccharide synthesis enzyme CpsA, sugar transferase n=1 Tax=Klebsiella pneumoniae TaxID=573 RepID=A0A455TK40_KLEPN|nr:Capsular polysaccharide synthesis enzyme CpsA, sugar transferase [Klebsiella pneumoniae]
MFAGKKSAQIREILISESTWEEMTCLFAPSLIESSTDREPQYLRRQVTNLKI